MITQQIIDWLIPVMCGGIVTIIGMLVKCWRSLVGGLLALLRADLNRIHTEYVQVGRPVSIELKDEADDIYSAYHALGGNGVGSELHRQILAAHAAADHDKGSDKQ